MHYALPKRGKHRIATQAQERAIGLAEIAEAVVLTSPDNPVAKNGLVITSLAGALGIRVCTAASPDPVLYVGSQGQIYAYQPEHGPNTWQRRLVELVQHPELPDTRVQVTLEVPVSTLKAAAVEARETPRTGRTSLELVGLAALKEAMATTHHPLMP